MPLVKQNYIAINRPVLNEIPTTAARILDVGCGTGTLGSEVKARQHATITGITYSEQEAAVARDVLDQVVVADLNEFNGGGLEQFDCIVCSHVLEHLLWPEQLVARLRPLLKPGGRLVVALPNLLVFRSRVSLLLGRFRYTDYGIMDRTHFRFFDWTTARSLLTDAGFSVFTAYATGGFPGSRFLPVIGRAMDCVAVRVSPGLFGWQFVLVAQ